jgi:hypothetical protein
MVGEVGRQGQPAEDRVHGGGVAAGASTGEDHGLAEKPGRPQVHRAAVDVDRRTRLHDPALAHDGHPTGRAQRLGLVVGHEHAGGPGRAEGSHHLVAKARPQRGVEGAEGLVQEDHLGRGGQRPCQRHALLLTARQLVGTSLSEPGQTDQIQQLTHPGPAFGT